MTDTFRALCSELHAAFNTYAVGEEHHQLLVRAATALAQPEPESADQANLDIESKLQKARDEEFRACRQWLTLNVELGGNLSDEICIARRNDRYWNDLKK